VRVGSRAGSDGVAAVVEQRGVTIDHREVREKWERKGEIGKMRGWKRDMIQTGNQTSQGDIFFLALN